MYAIRNKKTGVFLSLSISAHIDWSDGDRYPDAVYRAVLEEADVDIERVVWVTNSSILANGALSGLHDGDCVRNVRLSIVLEPNNYEIVRLGVIEEVNR